jgi:hypothetical protein
VHTSSADGSVGRHFDWNSIKKEIKMRQIIGAAAFMAMALIAVPTAAQVQAGHHQKNRAPVSYIIDFPLILGIGY